jgi:ABC-type transporter Mla subunit MlaD
MIPNVTHQRPHPMAGAPRWAWELYLKLETLEWRMSELQDQLDSIASELLGAANSMNDGLLEIEQQLAAGAQPDLSGLKAAADSIGNIASRLGAVGAGQPDPGAAPAPAIGDQSAGLPAADPGSAPDLPATPPTGAETIDTASQPPTPADPTPADPAPAEAAWPEESPATGS